MAASLVDSKLTAAPLIRVLKLGTRFDPKGAIAPKFGSKVKTIEPENLKRRMDMEINGVPAKGLEVNFTRKGVGPPSIVVKKPETGLTDDLARGGVSNVREKSPKGVKGKGTAFDITA